MKLTVLAQVGTVDKIIAISKTVMRKITGKEQGW